MKPKCCNGNCLQGRKCPEQPRPRSRLVSFGYTVLIVVLIFLFGVVGRMDYEAALTTEQIVKSTASQGR